MERTNQATTKALKYLLKEPSMTEKRQPGSWFKPLAKPMKPCGCVYSVVGYLLWACPQHREEMEDVQSHAD